MKGLNTVKKQYTDAGSKLEKHEKDITYLQNGIFHLKNRAFNYPVTHWVVYTFLNKASNFIFSWWNIKSAGTANLTFLSLQFFSDSAFQGAMLLVDNKAPSVHPVDNF